MVFIAFLFNFTLSFKLSHIMEGSDDDNIWMACSDGNIDCIKNLIQSGISINSQDENGYSPM